MSFKEQKIEEVLPIKVALGLKAISRTSVGGTGRNAQCGKHSARDTDTSVDVLRLAT